MAGFRGTFSLIRRTDVTGVSGTGHVADGAELPDGTVVVRWKGKHATTTVHGGLESVEYIHLHGGLTELHWHTRACAKCLQAVMVEGILLLRSEEHGEACSDESNQG